MCGRSRSTLNRQQVASAARVTQDRITYTASYEPSYNLSPGHDAPVVRCASDGQREVVTMRWGLVPSWTKKGSKPDHFRMFNARSETVAEKSVFSRLLGSQRCVVLFEGFYEWKKDGSKKQPYYIHLGEDKVLRMAGLWDTWRASDDAPALHTFTILTTDSSKRLSWLHDRMPVLLTTPEAEEAWLSGDKIDFKTLNQISKPYNGEDLQWHEVNPAMGKPSFQEPEACKPLKKGPGISAFFKKPTAKKAEPTAEAGKPPASDSAAAPASSVQEQPAAPSVGKHERGAVKEVPAPGRQEPTSSEQHAVAVKTEAASALPLEKSSAAAAAAASSERGPSDADVAELRGADVAAGSAPVKAELQAEQRADPNPATAPALPLNPDEDIKAVKAEEVHDAGGDTGAAGSQAQEAAPHGASPGRKRTSDPSQMSPSKSAAKRGKKEGPSPVLKGQKTMNAFFKAR